MDKEKIEKIIANKLNEYRFELPKDEYDLVAEELAETIVKNCSIPDVLKSLPQHTDGCRNDRDKCSCKNWGGCPVD
jgi:hypothetical protein